MQRAGDQRLVERRPGRGTKRSGEVRECGESGGEEREELVGDVRLCGEGIKNNNSTEDHTVAQSSQRHRAKYFRTLHFQMLTHCPNNTFAHNNTGSPIYYRGHSSCTRPHRIGVGGGGGLNGLTATDTPPPVHLRLTHSHRALRTRQKYEVCSFLKFYTCASSVWALGFLSQFFWCFMRTIFFQNCLGKCLLGKLSPLYFAQFEHQ